MKKATLVLFLLFVSFLSFSSANSDLDQAVSWMNSNWLTKFTNTQDFMATNNLRRDEASKFFVQYAVNILSITTSKSDVNCIGFLDLYKARPDLTEMIRESCNLWMFKWYDLKFMPTDKLTNWQAITVLIRLIDWPKDETQWHFAQKYYEKASELGILDGLNISNNTFDKLITRGTIAKLLYKASTLSTWVASTKIEKETIAQNPSKYHLIWPDSDGKYNPESWYVWANQNDITDFSVKLINSLNKTGDSKGKCPVSFSFSDCLDIETWSPSKWMSEAAFMRLNMDLLEQWKDSYRLSISDSYLWKYYCKETKYEQECFRISNGIVWSATTIYYHNY